MGEKHMLHPWVLPNQLVKISIKEKWLECKKHVFMLAVLKALSFVICKMFLLAALLHSTEGVSVIEYI